MGKVKELREAANIKQESMASLLGVSPASYSKKENGHIKYTLDEAKAIAVFFNKTIEEIFFADEVSKNETQ